MGAGRSAKYQTTLMRRDVHAQIGNSSLPDQGLTWSSDANYKHWAPENTSVLIPANLDTPEWSTGL
jgi:hypothetical protein